MTVKKRVFQLHKILGLTTGLVVFVVAITGCCWAFKEEIESLYDDYKKVSPKETPMLTPTEAKALALKQFPENTVHGTVFKKPDDAIEVIFYDAEPEFYQSVFLNPYSGEVIQIDDHLSGFFAFVLKGHMRLWLPKAIGEQVVRISILVFILILISGLMLWWPKKRKNLNQRLRFDWKKTTRWKRKNFDLHTVVGFYTCTFALILALTGSIIAYNWMKYGVYKTLGGQKETAFSIPDNQSLPDQKVHPVPMDVLIPKLQKERPDAIAFELHYPETEDESIYVEITNTQG